MVILRTTEAVLLGLLKFALALLILPTIILLSVPGGAEVALEEIAYPGTEWKTVHGDTEAINKYCKGALGSAGEKAKWAGCILPERKIIATSGLKNCLHEAVHAADKEWGNTPQHRLLFRAEEE